MTASIPDYGKRAGALTTTMTTGISEPGGTPMEGLRSRTAQGAGAGAGAGAGTTTAPRVRFRKAEDVDVTEAEDGEETETETENEQTLTLAGDGARSTARRPPTPYVHSFPPLSPRSPTSPTWGGHEGAAVPSGGGDGGGGGWGSLFLSDPLPRIVAHVALPLLASVVAGEYYLARQGGSRRLVVGGQNDGEGAFGLGGFVSLCFGLRRRYDDDDDGGGAVFSADEALAACFWAAVAALTAHWLVERFAGWLVQRFPTSTSVRPRMT